MMNGLRQAHSRYTPFIHGSSLPWERSVYLLRVRVISVRGRGSLVRGRVRVIERRLYRQRKKAMARRSIRVRVW